MKTRISDDPNPGYARATAFVNTWTAVAYSNNQFVAVAWNTNGGDSAIITSL